MLVVDRIGEGLIAGAVPGLRVGYRQMFAVVLYPDTRTTVSYTHLT